MIPSIYILLLFNVKKEKCMIWHLLQFEIIFSLFEKTLRKDKQTLRWTQQPLMYAWRLAELTTEKFMTFRIQTVRAKLTIMVTSRSSSKKYRHLFLQPYSPTGYTASQAGRWRCKECDARMYWSWVIWKTNTQSNLYVSLPSRMQSHLVSGYNLARATKTACTEAQMSFWKGCH